MTGPFVLFTLRAPANLEGVERSAIVVLDASAGGWVAIERFEHGTVLEATNRLLEREHFPRPSVVLGPELRVPARQLYDVTDMLSGRGARRQRSQERMSPGAPMRPEDVPGRQGT